VSVLRCLIAGSAFLLQHWGVFRTSGKLLRYNRVLLLQKLPMCAGLCVPVLEEQVGPVARSLADRLAAQQREVIAGGPFVRQAGDRRGCRSTGSPGLRRVAAGVSRRERT
jgi:hypothetical protein